MTDLQNLFQFLLQTFIDFKHSMEVTDNIFKSDQFCLQLTSIINDSYLWDVIVVIVFLVQAQYTVHQGWQLGIELFLW